MAFSPSVADNRPLVFDRMGQIKAGLIVAAFVAVFWNLLDFVPPEFGSIVHRWIHESDWSHGPIIPLFSVYLVYLRWERIRRAAPTHTWVGLVILLAALAVYQWCLWNPSAFYFLRPVSMLLGVLGIIIFLRGLPVMRYLWVPWLYLFFAIPLPKGWYFAMTDPLRRMAAIVATAVLGLASDLDIERVGSVIEYIYQGKPGAIGVADACSGMRSTMTLCALGVAVAFMSERPWWQRLIMIVSCVPIAVFCNFIRVTVTCALHIYVHPKYATGNYHMALGLLLLLVAFTIFNGIGWILSNLTVEDSEPEPQAG